MFVSLPASRHGKYREHNYCTVKQLPFELQENWSASELRGASGMFASEHVEPLRAQRTVGLLVPLSYLEVIPKAGPSRATVASQPTNGLYFLPFIFSWAFRTLLIPHTLPQVLWRKDSTWNPAEVTCSPTLCHWTAHCPPGHSGWELKSPRYISFSSVAATAQLVGRAYPFSLSTSSD